MPHENSSERFGELRSLLHHPAPCAKTWRALVDALQDSWELERDWTERIALPYAKDQLEKLWGQYKHLCICPAKWREPELAPLAAITISPLDGYLLANTNTRMARGAREIPSSFPMLSSPLPERATLAQFFTSLDADTMASQSQGDQLTLYSESFGWERRSIATGELLASGDASLSRGVYHPSETKLYPGDFTTLEPHEDFAWSVRNERLFTFHDGLTRALSDFDEPGAAWSPDGDHVILVVWDNASREVYGDGSPKLMIWHVETDQVIHERLIQDLDLGFLGWIHNASSTADGRHLIVCDESGKTHQFIDMFADECRASSAFPTQTSEVVERLVDDELVYRLWDTRERLVCISQGGEIFVEEGHDSYQLQLPDALFQPHIEATLSRGRHLTLTCMRRLDEIEGHRHEETAWCLVWDLDTCAFTTFAPTLSEYSWSDRPATYDPDLNALIYQGSQYYAGVSDRKGVYLGGTEVHINGWAPPRISPSKERYDACLEDFERCNLFLANYFRRFEGTSSIGEVWYNADDPRRESGRFFEAPASPEEIAAAEQRLGAFLPPLYRTFLEFANGCEQFHTLPLHRIWELLPTDRIDWGEAALRWNDTPEGFEEQLGKRDPMLTTFFRESLVIGVQRNPRGFSFITLDPKARNHEGAWTLRVFTFDSAREVDAINELTMHLFLTSFLA